MDRFWVQALLKAHPDIFNPYMYMHLQLGWALLSGQWAEPALMYGPIHQLNNVGHALRISFGPMNAPKAMKIFAKLQTQPIYYSAYVYALLRTVHGFEFGTLTLSKGCKRV